MKAIDLSAISWKSEGRILPIAQMHTDHIIRALGWLECRADAAKRIQKEIPIIFQKDLHSIEGRSFDEWKEIFTATLELRAKDAAAVKRAALEAEIAALESPEEKLSRLRAELEKI